VAVPSHATEVTVIAFRPDRRPGTIWQKHGAVGALHCSAAPTAPSHRPSTPPKRMPTAHAPQPKPKPTSVAPPKGEAGPATPVKAQPQFTG
jgi:hypothetical protein